MTADTLERAFQLAILLHVIAGVITVAFVIPLQIEQLGVKNGLKKLRRQLLLRGVLSLVVILMAIFSLTARWFLDNGLTLRFAIVFFVFTHAVGVLGKAIIDYFIYHQQYSPENKELHEKLEKVAKSQKKEYK